MNIYRVSILTGCLLLLLTSRLPAEDPVGGAKDFGRYQVIVDRSPFGAVSAAGGATPVPNFATRFQFAGLISSNSGPLQAILYDKESKRTFFCMAGQKLALEGDLMEVKVEQIDPPPAAKVVLRRGLEPATLRFEEKTATPGAPQPPGGMPPGFATGGAPPPASDVRRIPFRRTTTQ
jgi:hypothetical protein